MNNYIQLSNVILLKLVFFLEISDILLMLNQQKLNPVPITVQINQPDENARNSTATLSHEFSLAISPDNSHFQPGVDNMKAFT